MEYKVIYVEFQTKGKYSFADIERADGKNLRLYKIRDSEKLKLDVYLYHDIEVKGINPKLEFVEDRGFVEVFGRIGVSGSISFMITSDEARELKLFIEDETY